MGTGGKFLKSKYMAKATQDVVAGRTAAQIERAKRQAVGGRKKRCVKGKSCSAACIAANKICLVDIPWVAAEGLNKAREEIQKVGTVNPPVAPVSKEGKDPREVLRAIRKDVKVMEEEFAKVRELEKQNLPSGEKWRIDTARDNAERALSRALINANDLPPSMRDKAIATIKSRETAAKNPILTPKEREAEIDRLLKGWRSATILGKGEEARQLKEQARSLLSGFSGNKREQMAAKIDRAVGEMKPLKFGTTVESYQELGKIGKDTLDKYPQIRSARSILQRYDRIQGVIKSRITAVGTTEDERAKLAHQWMQAEFMKNSANDKMLKAMERLREEMLQTSLSKAQITQALNRIEFVKSAGIADVRRHVTEFIRMFNGRGITDVDNPGSSSPLLRIGIEKGRAFAMTTLGYVGTNGTRMTTFHEIAHLVEYQRGWMSGYAFRWMREKAFSEDEAADRKITAVTMKLDQGRPLFGLNQLIGPMYRADELAFADTYMHPYMGKVYPDKRSTEVWSMALQQFSSPDLMAQLYTNHPELFEIGVGMSKS